MSNIINYVQYRLLFLLIVTTCLFTACTSTTNKTDETAKTESNSKKNTTATEKTPPRKKIPMPSEPGVNLVHFKAADGLNITANLFHINPDWPVMVLCHQARSCKYEYDYTARMFNNEGFNCLAVDQRSGGAELGGNNATAQLAKSQGKSTEYIDAEQDVIAAIDYAFNLYGKKIILVGSSYSAALALKIGNENEQVKAVMAFSPGEYFADRGKTYIQGKMKAFNKPLFITSAKKEAAQCKPFIDEAIAELKLHFIPKGEGVHGSKALWEKTDNNAEYWDATKAFLSKIK